MGAKSKLTEKEVDKASAEWQKLNSASRLSVGWASSGGELAKAFGDLDVEGSGSIEVKDLALAIQAAQPGIDDEKVAAMLSLIDEDGDGTVTLQEFVMLMLFQVAPASASLLCLRLYLSAARRFRFGCSVSTGSCRPGQADGCRMRTQVRPHQCSPPVRLCLSCLSIDGSCVV